MQTSVLNLRLSDDLKSLIAAEAIRDGRSMSQVALRALALGMAQITAPLNPPPVAKVAKAAKATPKAAKATPKAAKAKAKATKTKP